MAILIPALVVRAWHRGQKSKATADEGGFSKRDVCRWYAELERREEAEDAAAKIDDAFTLPEANQIAHECGAVVVEIVHEYAKKPQMQDRDGGRKKMDRKSEVRCEGTGRLVMTVRCEACGGTQEVGRPCFSCEEKRRRDARIVAQAPAMAAVAERMDRDRADRCTRRRVRAA